MKPDLSQHLPVRDAALTITLASGRFCGADVLRRAARRVGVLQVDEHGRAVISSRAVQTMATNYASVGYLIRRGQKAWDEKDLNAAADALPAAVNPQLSKTA